MTARVRGPAGPRSNATASWVHWYNTTRIHHSIGKRSPIEFEALHARACDRTAQEPAA